MKEIKFKIQCPIKDYPQALQQEIKELHVTCSNGSTFNTKRNVNTLLHWQETRQGHQFWYDLCYGKDMSAYKEWLHLFEETESEPQYEIY